MICFVLFAFSILVSAIDGETAAFKPTDVILINCGTTSKTFHVGGRTWTPEQPKFFASNPVNASFPVSEEEESVTPRVPYKTARIFRSKFTYIFSVSPGWKFLRLHFSPTGYGIHLSASFSVTVNGFTLLENFSCSKKDLDLRYSYLIKEFIIPVLGGRNKTLNLTLTPSPHSLAFLNGVEIVSMPDRLYTNGGFYGYVKNVGSTIGELKIDDTTALETIYRLDIGRGGILYQITNDSGKGFRLVDTRKNKNDSGMFRRWLNDSGIFVGDEYSEKTTSDDDPFSKINYTEKTPAYVAPEEVYASMLIGKNVNLTWLFPVNAGFNYLVRLHFCDISLRVTQPGQRMFSIVIGSHIAMHSIDVVRLSGGTRIPVYLDFYTSLASDASKSGKRPNLRLDLCPNRYFDEPFINGIEILKLNDSKGNLAGPKLKPIMTLAGGKSHFLGKILIVFGSAIGLATFIVFVMLMKRKNRKDNNVVMFKVLLKQYTYAELKRITRYFSRTLGKGGFGTVYRGKLLDGRKVAIKVLKDVKGNGEDFINEVTSMSQTSHVNIVSLLGFCNEGSKRAIVYEFLENGSLDQFISRGNLSTLNVTTLYGIALGVARGLEYLHYGCRKRIVHFDIKPQNILLDGNLCPKVSDFGLAKLCEKRESIMSLIDARGTIGYIAPEVFSRTYGGVSHKSNVYSYGMLVLDMIGARNKETATSNASTAYFPDWIYKDLENGEQTWRFGDEITEEEKETAKKMILVGLWCIQPCPIDRPPMSRVVEMMEGSIDALEVPRNPSMHISTRFIAESSSLSDSGETGENSNSYTSPTRQQISQK